MAALKQSPNRISFEQGDLTTDRVIALRDVARAVSGFHLSQNEEQ
jgi:hypothetical protein